MNPMQIVDGESDMIIPACGGQAKIAMFEHSGQRTASIAAAAATNSGRCKRWTGSIVITACLEQIDQVIGDTVHKAMWFLA